MVAFSFLLGSPQIETLLLLLHTTYSNSRPLTRIEELLEPTIRQDALRAFSPHTLPGTAREPSSPLSPLPFRRRKCTPTNQPRPTNETTMTKKIFTISHTSKFSSCFILHHPPEELRRAARRRRRGLSSQLGWEVLVVPTPGCCSCY